MQAWAATQQGRVTGVVRDSQGIPQIGALVELLRPDYSLAAKVFTDDHGRYSIATVVPGMYSLKASGALFLPTLRENLQIPGSARVVVNLTLSTLYEAFRWLPAAPRRADEPQDDWAWTLRLSANRPLLRMLQDGPLVVVNDGDGTAAALKARVTIRGGASDFGDGGLHHDFELERSSDDSHQLILRADLSQAESAALNAVAGYEQRLAPGRVMRTVAAFEDRPDIAGGPQAEGFGAVMLRVGETMDVSEAVTAEFGTEMVGVHLGENVMESHPFAGVTVHTGTATAISWQMATSEGAQHADRLDTEASLMPAVVEQNGHLAMEHGLHQQLGFTHTHGKLMVAMSVYRDRLEHPVVIGGGTITEADWKSGNLLYDSSTDLLKVAGQNYSGDGLLGEVQGKLGHDASLTFYAAMGDALAMSDAPSTVSASLQQDLGNLKAKQSEMYAVALTGKLHHAGTQWRASYRWQPAETLTRVDPFGATLPDAYLSFFLRQPIHYRRVIPNGVEALVDVRNLLAKGYRPFVTSDGSSLYFAQDARCLQGGLSFTF
nr:carboxypeptidase-like regulatory domain-containing protein [Paracidobacterium acidisoli]